LRPPARIRFLYLIFLQESDDGVADAGKAKLGGIDLGYGNPKSLSGVVSGFDGRDGAVHPSQVIHIERMDAHTAIDVDVGRREEILDVRDVKACLLLDFTNHTLLYRFTHIDESARQVERSLGWFLGATDDQHLIVVVDDKCCRCGTGVGIVREPTVATLLALEVVHFKMLTTTNRTVLEYL